MPAACSFVFGPWLPSPTHTLQDTTTQALSAPLRLPSLAFPIHPDGTTPSSACPVCPHLSFAPHTLHMIPPAFHPAFCSDDDSRMRKFVCGEMRQRAGGKNGSRQTRGMTAIGGAGRGLRYGVQSEGGGLRGMKGKMMRQRGLGLGMQVPDTAGKHCGACQSRAQVAGAMPCMPAGLLGSARRPASCRRSC